MQETADEHRKAECANCKGERHCDVLGHHKESGGDDDFQWVKHWRILRCRGCDYVFIETVSSNSEDYVDFYNEIGETETDYRETKNHWPALSKRQAPTWFAELGLEDEDRKTSRLSEAMGELYGALNNDLTILSGIGLRTSFDIAAELLGIAEHLAFAEKLDALVDQKLIRDAERDHLSLLVEAGNASAHRGWRASQEELSTLMDILESFVEQAFVHPARQRQAEKKIAAIRDRVPARAAKKRKAKKA